MGYQLGVDLGTTYTAAAVHRDGKVEMCTLGSASPVMPSVVLLRADGEVLEGEVAVRRGLAEPTRVAREFKRRLGDPAPLVLGGTPYGAEALMGHLLRNVLATVTEREGSPPDRVVLTHPANFGPYKLDMMREVARLAGCDLDSTVFITEPEAAALSYAVRNRVEPGEIVAVYDFGGGTFDAALVRRTEQGFSLIGKPEGMERFGGIDIDAAIVSHVDQSLGGAIARLDTDDIEAQAAVSRLRDDCRQAKEALSGDTDTSITVSVPGTQTSVRLTRQELEDMVRPRLRETVEALHRAVRSAGLTMSEISRILLVGGSSRIPLVAETLQRDTGRPVAVDAHPKFAIAMGAAGYQAATSGGTAPVVPSLASQPGAPPPKPEPLSAGSVIPMPEGLPSLASTAATAVVPPAPTVPPPGAPPGRSASAPPPPPSSPPSSPTSAPPASPSGSPTGSPARARKGVLIGAGVAVVAALGVGAVLAFGGGDDAAPDNTEETRPRRTDPPETGPVANVDDTTTTVAGPVEETMSIAQINASVVTPADIAGDWVQVEFVPSTETALCGQTLPNTAEVVGGSAFQRTVNGQPQALVNDIESYASSAEAIENFQSFRSILTTCPSFDLTDPASGAVITTFVQFFDDTPQPGCQGAASIRLDSQSAGTNLTSSFFALQVCGANAISTRLDLPAFSEALPEDLRNEWIGSLLAATDRVVAISQFEGTGSGGTTDTIPPGIVTRENFLDLLSIGAGIEVTQEMKDCFLAQTTGLTQADFDAALGADPPEDVTTTIGAALVLCEVPLEV